ncbi:cellulase family glycosylhydrolase, partial [Candidatus Bathyarchaeota archaeon]|nr:cellulase family glycosylhydrolase [Candidatus Bathyarchaeota archaeon]
MTPQASASSYHEIYYDFDEPFDWNVVSGTWGIVNGSLEGFSNAEGLTYASDIIWKDCILTAKVKIAADSPRAEAAFCVRFADSRNFYWAGLGCWGHRVSISRMVDHVPEELIFSGDRADVAKDVWYNMSIRISGDAIVLYVNDVLELMVNDSTFTSGVVGVRAWNSHMLVDYVSVSTPELEIYRGFSCSGADFIYEKYTSEHFREIKQWGFNCVLVTVWWTRSIEQKKNAVGVYNEQNLQGLRRSVDLALSEGLKVIISGRVCYDSSTKVSWDGWATHDYVNLQDEGLNRYAKFWEMMVQRFPDCMYCLWHFPYH